jgi:N-ethylmaleimide reductase
MLRLAHLHLARTRSAFDYRALARPLFNGPLLLSAGLDRDSAASLIAQRAADAAVFGSLYLTNPDLLQRFAVGEPLNAPDRETFYSAAPGAMSTTLFWGKHWKWVRLIGEARRAPKLADWLVG